MSKHWDYNKNLNEFKMLLLMYTDMRPELRRKIGFVNKNGNKIFYELQREAQNLSTTKIFIIGIHLQHYLSEWIVCLSKVEDAKKEGTERKWQTQDWTKVIFLAIKW